MPISRSSKKSLRKSVKNRKVNVSFKNKLKTALKSFLAKPSAKGISEAQSFLDKANKKGLIHKNKAARLKSQLSKKIGQEPKKIVVKKTIKKTTKRTAKEKMSK